MTSFVRPLVGLLIAAVSVAWFVGDDAPVVQTQQTPGQRSPTPPNRAGAVGVEVVASGLEYPWAVAFLPDGRMLVTERPGRLRIVSREGTLSPPVAGVPEVVAQSQGGMLDVAVDPRFTENRFIYLSYSEPGEGGAGTSVTRARLGVTSLEGLQVIYQQRPKVRGGGHFGSRIVFAPDGKLFITQGDRQGYRDRAQDLSSGLGKIMRINTDGSVPPDNPFIGRRGAQPEIWSYGHRNVQGAALDPATGRLWTAEHGAMGGDELNHPERGKNYGWPVITYGRDYGGSTIGDGTVKEGMEQPVYYWDPVIAPSGLAFYTGDAFPDWKGSILIGGMGGVRALVRLTVRNGRVTGEERYQLGESRDGVRDVQQGPDGFIYVVTNSSQGQLLRVRPATR